MSNGFTEAGVDSDTGVLGQSGILSEDWEEIFAEDIARAAAEDARLAAEGNLPDSTTRDSSGRITTSGRLDQGKQAASDVRRKGGSAGDVNDPDEGSRLSGSGSGTGTGIGALHGSLRDESPSMEAHGDPNPRRQMQKFFNAGDIQQGMQYIGSMMNLPGLIEAGEDKIQDFLNAFGLPYTTEQFIGFYNDTFSPDDTTVQEGETSDGTPTDSEPTDGEEFNPNNFINGSIF